MALFADCHGRGNFAEKEAQSRIRLIRKKKKKSPYLPRADGKYGPKKEYKLMLVLDNQPHG